MELESLLHKEQGKKQIKNVPTVLAEPASGTGAFSFLASSFHLRGAPSTYGLCLDHSCSPLSFPAPLPPPRWGCHSLNRVPGSSIQPGLQLQGAG